MGSPKFRGVEDLPTRGTNLINSAVRGVYHGRGFREVDASHWWTGRLV
jgi:hypothetical protein